MRWPSLHSLRETPSKGPEGSRTGEPSPGRRRSRCGPISGNEPDDPNYVVTLLHGTFARGAAWTKEGSELVTVLRSRLKGRVRIERCEWSGWNSIGARRSGADGLAAHLDRLEETFPNARHYVIAHSHGGNIALYALRQRGLASRISGVVCIATPFLVARTRDLGRDGLSTLLAAPVLLSMLAWSGLRDDLEQSASWLPEVAGGILWTMATLAAVAFLFVRWDRLASRILETLAFPANPPPLLIMRAPGDEASALLIFFQFLSLLAVRLFHVISRLHARSEATFERWARHKGRLVLVLVAGIVLTPLVAVALLEMGTSPGVLVNVLMAMLLPLLVIPFLLLLDWSGPAAIGIRFVASMALVPASLILAVCMLPIDWRVGVANLLVDLTVEPAPPGTWTFCEVLPTPSAETPDLAHSVLYRDRDALQDLVSWIDSTGPAAASR